MISLKKTIGRCIAAFGFSLLAVSSFTQAQTQCQYSISNEWNTGYTGTIAITNNGSSAINGWNVTWQYNTNRITSSWNANVSGNNPYSASGLGWNDNIQPGNSVEFGFQVNKNGGAAETPIINGSACAQDNNSSASVSSASSSLALSSSSNSSSRPASSASSAPAGGGQRCNWYGTLYPLCNNNPSGWGWENNQSCIGSQTCSAQPAPYGIVGSNQSSAASSSIASSQNSSIAISSSSAVSSSVASSSSIGNGGFVSSHGHLRTNGNQLVDQHGAAIQLRGMSSHGLQWYGDYMNIDSIRWLRDDWHVNAVRAAMYTEEEGYLEDPSVKNYVYQMVDAAIALDIYVIVDWHILLDGNPQTHKAEAMAFFTEIAEHYGNDPHVIYEIANEPNGVNWNGAIRPYAQDVIPVIRDYAPDSLVIVGTGNWSQEVTDAAANPVSFANVAYTMHFYACSHGQWLRDRVDQARAQGAVIFSTEWGTADASGAGSVCENETRTWISFLNQRGISWLNWSLATKAEATAALNAGASTQGNWSANDLSQSGALVRSLLRE